MDLPVLSRSSSFVHDEGNVHDDLLENEIRLCREWLATYPSGHSERADACSTLADSLYERFEQTGSTAFLEEMVTLLREVLALQPAGHPNRADSCNNLASILLAQYQVTGSRDQLDDIIQLYRDALALRPVGHPDRAQSYRNLTVSLRERYQATESTGLLNEIITLDREALALHPDENSDCAHLCSNLANSLQERSAMTGSTDLLDETIELHREALAQQLDGHADRADSCNKLANILFARYQVTGSTDLLGETIALHREALALRPSGHPDRAYLCNNLADALDARYQVTGSTALLDENIMLHREALALRPPGHPDRANSCNNLASALHNRHHVTGSTSLLDEMVTLHREALALQPVGHVDRAPSCNNLALSLQECYAVTGDTALLDEIMKLHREALALQPTGHPYRAHSCNNLASALYARHQETGDTALFYETITLRREALALLPPGHPLRGQCCFNLAQILLIGYEKIKDVTFMNEALSLARESVSCSSPSSIGQRLLILCHIHLEEGSPRFSIPDAAAYLSLASTSDPDSVAQFMQLMQDCLDSMWSVRGAWTADTPLTLLDVYSNLIAKLPRMTGFAIDTTSQLVALKSVRSLGSDACIAAVMSGRPCQAIELIDHAHGVIWAQALNQRDPHLQDLPKDLASELETLLHAVSVPVSPDIIRSSEPATRYLSPEDLRHQQNSRIQTILTEVRAIPGLEQFMLGNTYAQLRKAACKHPVVVLVAARGLVYALVISDSAADSPHPLSLRISSDRLSSLCDYAGRAGFRNGQSMYPLDDDARLVLAKPIKTTESTVMLSELWLYVVKPVLDHLQLQPAVGRSRPRLHWCPTGHFVSLPLHAAGVYHGPLTKQVCCADYVVSSYTPTLSALLRAQDRTPMIAPAYINMLAIGEDCSTVSTMSTLQNIDQEMAHIRSTAQASRLNCTVETIASGATVERVTDRIQSSQFAHLACHGTQDPDNALQSGFHLSDGKLTVSKLMTLNLDKAWFAYLSACETAKGDEEQPDQVVHLAAAMLHAGFKSVVATMWSMSDVDGPEMAKWFYGELLSNEEIDADAVAYALDAAVGKLRKRIPLAPKRWAPYIHMGA